MLPSLAKAIGQIPDPPMMRVIRWGILGALLIYALLLGGFFVLMSNTRIFDASWADWSVGFLGTVALVVLLIFLFPLVLTLVISFLLEDVARAVEDRYYPGQPAAREQGVVELILTTLAFIGFALVLNLITVVVVFLIPFLNILLAPFSPAIFLAVNGFLLGREYFELVAFRRMDPATARSLRKAQSGRIWLAGIVIAFFLTIPVVNWVAPVIGTAFMLHEFESLRRRHGLV